MRQDRRVDASPQIGILFKGPSTSVLGNRHLERHLFNQCGQQPDDAGQRTAFLDDYGLLFHHAAITRPASTSPARIEPSGVANAKAKGMSSSNSPTSLPCRSGSRSCRGERSPCGLPPSICMLWAMISVV